MELINQHPKCSNCGLFGKTVPLMMMGSYLLCGNCVQKIMKKQKEQQDKWIEETLEEE